MKGFSSGFKGRSLHGLGWEGFEKLVPRALNGFLLKGRKFGAANKLSDSSKHTKLYRGYDIKRGLSDSRGKSRGRADIAKTDFVFGHLLLDVTAIIGRKPGSGIAKPASDGGWYNCFRGSKKSGSRSCQHRDCIAKRLAANIAQVIQEIACAANLSKFGNARLVFAGGSFPHGIGIIKDTLAGFLTARLIQPFGQCSCQVGTSPTEPSLNRTHAAFFWSGLSPKIFIDLGLFFRGWGSTNNLEINTALRPKTHVCIS